MISYHRSNRILWFLFFPRQNLDGCLADVWIKRTQVHSAISFSITTFKWRQLYNRTFIDSNWIKQGKAMVILKHFFCSMYIPVFLKSNNESYVLKIYNVIRSRCFQHMNLYDKSFIREINFKLHQEAAKKSSCAFNIHAHI